MNQAVFGAAWQRTASSMDWLLAYRPATDEQDPLVAVFQVTNKMEEVTEVFDRKKRKCNDKGDLRQSDNVSAT